MLLRAAVESDLDVARGVMVGNRSRDIDVGTAAGTMAGFVDQGYAERKPDKPELVVAEMKEAVEWIITKLAPQT